MVDSFKFYFFTFTAFSLRLIKTYRKHRVQRTCSPEGIWIKYSCCETLWHSTVQWSWTVVNVTMKNNYPFVRKYYVAGKAVAVHCTSGSKMKQLKLCEFRPHLPQLSLICQPSAIFKLQMVFRPRFECRTLQHPHPSTQLWVIQITWWNKFYYYYLIELQMGALSSVVGKALCYKPEGCGFDTRWSEFLNLPNPSSHTRPWGLLSL
jgi:hypothetical protein